VTPLKTTVRAQGVFTSEEVDKVLRFYEQADTPASRELIRGHAAIRGKFRAMRLAIDEAREKHAASAQTEPR
jgi:hypothetical protein